jgi:predicted transcriptional regulator
MSFRNFGEWKMKKTAKLRVTSDGIKGFFDRAHAHARKLDRGEELVPEITVSFESVSDMLRVLSAERVRLLRVTRERAASMSDLAVDLGRDTRAIARDVDLLERFGLLHSRYDENPGHGRRRIIESRASTYHLVATI